MVLFLEGKRCKGFLKRTVTLREGHRELPEKWKLAKDAAAALPSGSTGTSPTEHTGSCVRASLLWTLESV